MNNYIIYKAKNTYTGEIYIGATTKSLEERKSDHIQKSNKKIGSHFQEAISTYGPEAFSWEQIDTASNNDELAQKEVQYILEYSSNSDGYNSDSGGGFKKTVYQFDLEGNLKASYGSLGEIETSLGHNKRRISNACISNMSYAGSYWSNNRTATFRINEDSRKKKANQYALNGDLIASFESVSEASKTTGISKTCISRCCRCERKQSSGFLWKYS